MSILCDAIKGRVRAYRVGSAHDIFPPIPGLTRCAIPTNNMTLMQGSVLPGLWTRETDWQHNDVLYDWAAMGVKLFAGGDARYRIAGMYLEYANAVAPVPVPSVTRAGGIAYYNSLGGTPDNDYLRVPLTAFTVDSSDAELFPQGNRMTFFAMTQGVVGVHGKPFSDVANSTVIGGALVAIPDVGDRTKDLVFARFYLPVDAQQAKLATSQIGLEWQEELQ